MKMLEANIFTPLIPNVNKMFHNFREKYDTNAQTHPPSSLPVRSFLDFLQNMMMMMMTIIIIIIIIICLLEKQHTLRDRY